MKYSDAIVLLFIVALGATIANLIALVIVAKKVDESMTELKATYAASGTGRLLNALS
jgi:hypothetical protein